MKVLNKILIIIIFIFYGNCLKCQTLSMEQKIKDFEILYSVLKENYPNFGVNKRLHNIDWLSNKNKYLEQIKMTKTDLQYLNALKNILTDLNDGHVSFLPTHYYNNFYRIYSGIEEKENNGYYKPWIEELEKVDKQINYWTDLYDTLTVDTSHQYNSKIKGNKKELNHHLKLVTRSDSKIAVLKISTFSYFNIEKDRDTIFNFLKTLKEYKHLIIDIQDNGGGSTNYWKDLIVSHLTKDTIIYKTRLAVKDGAYTNMFFKHSVSEKKKITEFDTTNFDYPPELKNDNFYIYTINDTIIPSQFAGFTGDIYLLPKLSDSIFC